DPSAEDERIAMVHVIPLGNLNALLHIPSRALAHPPVEQTPHTIPYTFGGYCTMVGKGNVHYRHEGVSMSNPRVGNGHKSGRPRLCRRGRQYLRVRSVRQSYG